MIRFPSDNLTTAGQNGAYFTVMEEGSEHRIRFHDYASIYKRPGLYEQLFYDRLKCTSPGKLSDLLRQVVRESGSDPTHMRVLDVGAGNGMVGEQMVGHGAARMVGVDIIPEAAMAADRDRPGTYDAYYVTDLTALDPAQKSELADWNFDAMITVAALGFGDIPVQAFSAAYNLIADSGWIAFNISACCACWSAWNGRTRGRCASKACRWNGIIFCSCGSVSVTSFRRAACSRT